MKASELRSLTVDELNEKVNELKREFFNLRFQSVTGEIQNPRRMREVKKEMARVLTVKTEKTKKES